MIKSRIDPTRNTVGSIYKEIVQNNTDSFIIAGDLTNELSKSLVNDLNETIESNPFDGEPFFITIYEKKDLQMKRAILRRLYVSKYRPYPEDDTVVFFVEPKSNKVQFCWCLPHHSEMDNILMNQHYYNEDLVNDVKAWKSFDLKHFGFTYIGKTLVPSKVNRDKDIKTPTLN